MAHNTFFMAWPLIFFIAGLVLVSAGCLMPARWCPPLPNDKLMHFTAFGGLALLAGMLARTDLELVALHLALFLAGWLIEVLQNWVPGRRFCWRDLLANTAGIAVAGVVLAVFKPFA